MSRGEDRTLALLEESTAAAVGTRERAFWIMYNAQEPEVVEMAAVVHEYAQWWIDKVNEAKATWQGSGQQDVYTSQYTQGTFIK